jgi:hypothetical protein
MEKGFVEEAQRMREKALGKPAPDAAIVLREFTEKCLRRVYDDTPKWTTDSLKAGNSEATPVTYRNFWNRYNVKAQLQL